MVLSGSEDLQFLLEPLRISFYLRLKYVQFLCTLSLDPHFLTLGQF